MKKLLKYSLLVFALLIAVFVFQNYPASSEPKNLPRLADTSNIKKNLEAIINTPKSRNYLNTDVLDSVARYIRQQLLTCTDTVSVQEFKVGGRSYSNVIASFGPAGAERIIVGAHYDVCRDQDGADDNASGVAGLLELAKLLKGNTLKYRVDLVAYSLEEPPFFATEQMGSYVHARSLHDAGIAVKGMVSLEMIGYYSDEAGSQDYPVGLLKWFYGNKGNYITVVQKSVAGDFAKQFKTLSFANNSILTKSFRAPSFFGGIDLSDHRNYWAFGYSAVMVTNTSFYRNKSYHQQSDTLKRLNIPNMGLVVDGVYRVLKAMP